MGNKTVNQLAKILPSAWDANSATHYSKLTDAVNSLLGYNGPTVLANSLDLNSSQINNVADPVEGTDAVNLQTAEGKYSPSVVGPQLDVNGTSPMKGLSYLYYQKYVNGIIAGTGVTISSPKANGTGVVTINANIPLFGAGAPSAAGAEGQLYFNTSVAPYAGYVYHSGVWHAFS